MCFNQTGDISTWGGSSLKLVIKFTYLGSNVSSTEKDIDTRLAKAWTANVNWNLRSYGSQTWPIKSNAVSSKLRPCRYCYMDAQCGRWLNKWRKNLTATTQEFWVQFWTSPGGNTPQSSSCTAAGLPSRKLSKTNQTCRTLLKKHGRAQKWSPPMDPLTWPSKSRVTCSNLHTVALATLPYRSLGGVAREGLGYPYWWHDKMIMMIIVKVLFKLCKF